MPELLAGEDGIFVASKCKKLEDHDIVDVDLEILIVTRSHELGSDPPSGPLPSSSRLAELQPAVEEDQSNVERAHTLSCLDPLFLLSQESGPLTIADASGLRLNRFMLKTMMHGPMFWSRSVGLRIIDN